jgi:hypothetical protein
MMSSMVDFNLNPEPTDNGKGGGWMLDGEVQDGAPPLSKMKSKKLSKNIQHLKIQKNCHSATLITKMTRLIHLKL